SPLDSDKVRNPCATVDPNGPCAARPGSTWIHCRSPVRVANCSTCSCVISTQRLVPRSLPARLGRSVTATVVAALCSLAKFGLPVSVVQRVADVGEEPRRRDAIVGTMVVGQPENAGVVYG